MNRMQGWSLAFVTVLLALVCGHGGASGATTPEDLLLRVPAVIGGANQAIVFTTEGDSFSPVLVVEGNPTVLWTFADGTTSASTTPTKNYGTAATRKNRLVVTPWSAARRINIGYDAGDGGTWSIESVPDQHVSKVEGLRHVAPYLAQWCSSYNLLESLDFHDFTNLDTIECYYSQSLRSVNLANTPKLRRACFENCDLAALDLSGSPNLEDLRGALNAYPTISFGSIGANVWHICVRDNPQMTTRSLFADMSPYPDIAELFIWSDNQSGALRIPASHSELAVSFIGDDNAYTTLDLRGALRNTAATGHVSFQRNAIAAVNIDGCSQITTLDVNGNQLDATAVDDLLATLDGLGRVNDHVEEGVVFSVNLTGNAAPGSAGATSARNLAAKGWTVSAEGVSLDPAIPTNGEQRIDFTTSGDESAMRCDFGGSGVTAAWHWADGSTSPAVSGVNAGKTGLGPGEHANFLVISNGRALRRFGAAEGGGVGRLLSMSGFENTPNLRILFAYNEDGLTSIGRVAAARIDQYHLKGTALEAAALDQLFADAVASGVTDGSIWCDGSGTAGSDADRATLLGRGWALDM